MSRQDILMLVSIVGNVTNAGLTVYFHSTFYRFHSYCFTFALLKVFTMSVLDDYSVMFRMWFFVLFQWFCFGTQVLKIYVMNI